MPHWAYLEQIRPQSLPPLPPAGSHIFQQGYASLPGVPLPFGLWEPITVKLPHLDTCRRPSFSITSLGGEADSGLCSKYDTC